MNIQTRLVSMPSTTVFDRQDKEYRDFVLGEGRPVVAIEAGRTDGWWKYIRGAGTVIGLDRFGESAPASELFKLLVSPSITLLKLFSTFFLKENKHDYSSCYYRLRPHRSQRPPRFLKKKWPDVKIVAINDTAKPEATVHLTKFDTTHGKFNGDVYWDDGHLVVNGDRISCAPSVIRRSFLGRSGRRYRSRMHGCIPR